MKEKAIYYEMPNDALSPMLVYQVLGGKGCCILELNQEKGEKTSFIGINPIGTFHSTDRQIEWELEGEKRNFEGDPYEALKEFSFKRRSFGFITYNAIRLKEELPDRHRHSAEKIPDLFFHLYKTLFIFDHHHQIISCRHEGTQEELDALLQSCWEPVRSKPFKTPKKIDIQPDVSHENYIKLVERAKEYIRAGDVFQVVISRTLHAQVRSKPFDIYRALRQTSPSPYLFFFEEEDFAIAGASPELLISIQKGEVESIPIAGTYPKTKDINKLLMDTKECAEHVMLVDLARNDVGAIAVVGSVKVPEYKVLKSFSHVNHIISRVIGRLDPKLHVLDAFKASFPAGTLSGAPKIRAMEIIDELEHSRRGLYGGAIVTLDEAGDLISSIAIRTAFIRGNRVEVRVGAGIVLDSDPEKEAQETMYKARSVIEALELAEGGME